MLSRCTASISIVIDATRAASAHRFALKPGNHLPHEAMNAGTERNMPDDAAVDVESVGALPSGSRHDWLRRSAAAPSERPLLARRADIRQLTMTLSTMNGFMGSIILAPLHVMAYAKGGPLALPQAAQV